MFMTNKWEYIPHFFLPTHFLLVRETKSLRKTYFKPSALERMGLKFSFLPENDKERKVKEKRIDIFCLHFNTLFTTWEKAANACVPELVGYVCR